MNRKIHPLLKDTCEIFKKDDPVLYKKTNYLVHKATKNAKREFQNKLEAQIDQTDARQMWNSLNTIAS